MGLLDRIIGGNSDDTDDVEFEEEEDDDEVELVGEDNETVDADDSEDEQVEEYSSAYDYSYSLIEPDGHASMKDFIEKVMYLKCRNSNMYRDRISNGVETIDSITTSAESIKRLRGNDDDDTDWEEAANKLESANRVIDGVDKLSGEEDMIVREGIGLAKDFVEAYSSRDRNSDSGDVDSTMNAIDDDL